MIWRMFFFVRGERMKEDSCINVFQAKPGMLVSRPIYNENGQVLMGKDCLLTPKSIMKLRQDGVKAIYIKSQSLKTKDEVLIHASISQTRDTEAFKRFQVNYNQSIEHFKIVMSDFLTRNKKMDIHCLVKEVDSILAVNQNGMQLFDMLHCMRHYDNATYIHCVNVALICYVMGKWLHLKQKELEVVMLAGLLHDIGKLMMPATIIKKPGRLTPEERKVVEQHPLIGYQILKDEPIDVRIKKAALQHHEKCDGSGYPYGLKAQAIEDFSKIVTIADIYDAMTAHRVYRQGLCPFEVIALFENEGFQKYEVKYLLTFLEGLAESYINKPVLLNNGQRAQIIMINKTKLSKPVVSVQEHYLNLAKEPKLFIKTVL